MPLLWFLQLVSEAKQQITRHNFAAAREILTEAIALHPSYKVISKSFKYAMSFLHCQHLHSDEP